MRPNLLKRAHSHNKQTLNNLLHSRGTSPHPQPETISGHKQIEEETLPKYNPDHWYPVRLGEVLHHRYEIVVKLGFGMTATVWLARDLQADGNAGNRKYVTVKINVNTLGEDFQKGRREIAQKLFSANPKHPGYSHVRFMLDTFKVKGKHGDHLCIVYDVLREPIDLCMEKFPGRRFSCPKLRILLPALLQGLDYMHSECHVVHTDLKADNIMMGLGDPNILDHFVQNQIDHPAPRKAPDGHGRVIYTSCSDFGEPPNEAVIASAKITDIGLAAWGDEKNTKPIQSNAFMAPEVILQAGWSYPADIWNLGVMLWDLFEHFGLFDRIDTKPGQYHPEQHLGLMIALMGPPPKDFLKRCAKAPLYFDSDGQFKYPEYIEDHTFESSIVRLKGEEKEMFIDFAKKMIAWVPEERWTAKQLLEHPFLTKEKEFFSATPSLSRASTASISSMIPSRAVTPGIPPSGSPNPGPNSSPNSVPNTTLLPPRLLELVPSLSSAECESSTNCEETKTEKLATNNEKSTSRTSLSLRPKMESLAESNNEPDVEVPNSKRLSVNKANKCSQDIIDAILSKGKNHNHRVSPEAK
ncbi:uncharacterized protein Z519_02063 [Cladophialophora bantiana CBS 173.52]|uniref:non-specific serine/threonine protein kinase n=1 Tax=Cladophialophora bantiana (strain ATCC 10958 / CBS 173.52 / CDC B-1940 / NIH 8579) TaxID=1442370 RepID=A0A0D2GE58_CLAB1|nr:uncharacterized protein Z519_02063 [Cladophialophora bantiana CBS 173.52]KIW96672.1 hypothetical protein Z519_02063 [Cladophialophora bantiana CBS 173.52]